MITEYRQIDESESHNQLPLLNKTRHHWHVVMHWRTEFHSDRTVEGRVTML